MILSHTVLITEVPMEEHAGGGRNGYHVVVGAFRRLSKVSNFSYLIFLFFKVLRTVQTVSMKSIT